MLDPNEHITVTRSDLGPVAVVHVSGEVDISTIDTMSEYVLDHLAQTPPALVIDLSGVVFMGSAGLGLLIEAHQQADRTATTLRIVATSPPVLRPLEISGLLDLLPVRRTLTEALEGLPKGSSLPR
ncbi:anti-anti-sigma factor [Kibdelosporangium banguiense]|uniref:Anti-sigma factor antagonist n=1 Tax=Kibdelosporangium banguiense TaxID=1365924 RepID=A0ABS4T592_9PSEU|nr:STAS domain-containing protein [Kibdelosporangium banguiense]MBP2319635.1 anti-anti-sigma factor [Kibdelosporangium banguiense]